MHDYAEDVGQDSATKTPQDAYDKAHGSYEDEISEMGTEKKLPLAEMPKAPDPKPYK
jgi:hypothetical protein